MKPARSPSALLYESVLHGQAPAASGRQVGSQRTYATSFGSVVDRYWHYAVLLLWAAVCAVGYAAHQGQSWHFFVEGGRSMLCLRGSVPATCGLHVYAAHPELQIGPVSFVLAGLASAGGEDGAELAELVMTLAGLAVLLLIEQDALGRSGPVTRRLLQRRVLLAGVVFVPAWVDLSVRFAHLDDVLALLFTALAVRAVARGESRSVGVLLALAILSKPWAIAFLPLAMAVPAGRRLRTAAWAVVPVMGLAALFVLADPATLAAARFGIPNAPSSSLRVLGVNATTTPAWDRPVQFALGLALGAVAVLRGRWAAVVMVAAAARIALDPGVYSYYTAAILLGAVVWDVQARRGRIFPLWSWLVFAALFVCRYLPLQPHVLGSLRLGVCVIVVSAALLLKRPIGELFRSRTAM